MGYHDYKDPSEYGRFYEDPAYAGVQYNKDMWSERKDGDAVAFYYGDDLVAVADIAKGDDYEVYADDDVVNGGLYAFTFIGDQRAVPVRDRRLSSFIEAMGGDDGIWEWLYESLYDD